MEFINFEACLDDDHNGISCKDEVNFCVKKDNNFIDDSEEISEIVCKYYRFDNVRRSVEEAFEDDVSIESSIDLETSAVMNFCNNSDEEVLKLMI